MVDFGAVGGYASTILRVLFYAFAGLVIAGIMAGIAWLVMNERRFRDFVIIRSTDKAGNLQVRFDKGGIIKSKKTGNTFYQLKRDKTAKIGIESITYTFSKKGTKIVELFEAAGNYSTLTPRVINQITEYEVTRSDVDWAKDQFAAYQKAFTGGSKLWQLLPYMGLVLMFLALVIIGMYLIKAYPQMIGAMATVSENLMKAAQAQAGVIN